MAVKTYEIKMLGYENTFPVMVGEKKEFITFKKASLDEGEGYLHTDKKEIQKAIEASDKFKNKEIKLVVGELEEEDNSTSSGGSDNFEPAEFENVTDINGAVEVLKAEPYNVAHQSLRTPESVLKKAQEHNVTFPNWVVE